MKSGSKEMIFSFALHAAAFGAIFFLSSGTRGDAVVSAADPLLAMLADPNADPTKDAGLINEKRGVAEGSLDGNTLKRVESELERMNQAAEEALATPLPEPEPLVPEKPVSALPEESVPTPAPANPSPSAPVSAEPEKPKSAPASSTPTKKEPKKTAAVTGKKTSFAQWQKETGKRSGTASPGKKTSPSKNSGSGKSGAGVTKIDVGKIGVGSGKTFGIPGGTGGNGGDGGRAVASAQQAYAAEVAGKLATHLDNVLAQSPLKLEATVSVTVRLGVDAHGNIRLLEILGSSDSEVRARVANAVARIGKFRTPPEGRAFELRIPDVILRPL